MKYRVLLIAIILASCGNGNNRETSNKTEQSPQAKNTDVQPNNIVKGRYQCYRLSSAGDEVTSDLYILPGNKYQVDNATGTFSYDEKSKRIIWESGPLHQPSQDWQGIFTKKGDATGKGGHAVNSLIEIVRKADADAGNSKVLERCACAETE